jgi:hypothetical protein
MNNALLSNSIINDILLNNSRSDDDRFSNSLQLDFAFSLNLLSDSIRIIDVERPGDKFSAEETIKTLFSDSYNPPMINNPGPVIDDPGPVIDDPGPVIDDPGLLNGQPDPGCSEPVCTEDGICYSECVD